MVSWGRTGSLLKTMFNKMGVGRKVKTLKKFWLAVKRNPVIIAFFVAIATQVFQDWQEGKIDMAHFWGYLVMVFFSVATRQLVTPVSDPKIENKIEVPYDRNTL